MSDATVKRDLLEKYREILALRDADEAGTLPDPTPRLRALAARFPGALRELDILPRPALEAMLLELASPEVSSESLARHRTMHAFHAQLRGALEAKRWLGTDRAPDDDTRARFLAAALSTDAHTWADALPAIARPPRGRLIDLVVARLAAREGVPVQTVRDRVSPRHRASGTRGK